jgi:hypothetical protein
MSEAERLAQAIYETTAVDVANALAAETLDREDVPDDLLTALSDEGIEPDDDPDDAAGWTWRDGEAVAE